MQLRFLETFVHLAKVRNFRKAADLLHTSQPVISSRISALENELGAKLFERNRRGVQLTSEGRSILPHAELVIELTNEMKWQVAQSNRLTGSLRVGVTDTILRSWFIRLMETFRETYPGVNIEMLSSTSADIIQSLRDHSVDVGLAMMDGNDPKLDFVPLGAFPVSWVASPRAFPIRNASMNTLLDMPILSFPKNSIPYKTLERYLKTYSKVRPNVHSSNSIATIVQMAQEGLGVAPMPRAVVLDELAAGTLHEINVEPAFPPLAFFAISEASPRKALKDEFVKMARQEALAYSRAFPNEYLIQDD